VSIGPALRVLHIAPGEPFGGVQRIVLSLIGAQTDRHQVSVLWIGEARHAQHEYADGLHAHGTLAARIIMARDAIRLFKPDIIHLHMAPSWIAFALLGAPGRVCSHLHVTPSGTKGLKGWFKSALERWTIARADVLIAISGWIETRWRERYPTAQIRRVFNGTPLVPGTVVSRVTSETQPGVIGFASRLAADKGVREFAAFVLAMHERLPSVHFRIAGEGPEREFLEEELSSLLANGNAVLLGHVSDVAAFWSQLDLAIFTAPSEAFGLGIIEPVAAGVPVIAYKTGAGSDEVACNCAGIATVPFGEAKAMAELAVQLLADPQRRRAMARQGKVDVLRMFSLDVMTESIEHVYLELLNDTDRSIL
jgi:glycosyltransferase involved in cell wall biosynthesis